MKLRKLLLGLAATLGLLGLLAVSATPAAAAGKVDPARVTVYSGYQALKIYGDPECTTLTGKTLDTQLEVWQTFKMYYAQEPYLSPASYDLGGGQWVKASEVSAIWDNKDTFLEAYSDYKAISVYSTPSFMKQIATLAESVTDWKITRYTTYFDGYTALDLGHNQWIKYADIIPISAKINLATGSALFNANGVYTSPITMSGEYRVFEARRINNTLYLRLGNDNQWLQYGPIWRDTL
ncbi:hypothetical protein FC83_GL002944 [Agrilactobacillus composti DSM 18527 = JCM 14202]|uniref:Surface layer protein A domain-containing protein n=1 Tax=Agrilactobacillus composti DSM 18527 = JCM 14202 TaxID=1423734 RepID=X0PV03_9LACO|nr:hypothetical protein [Agrilactobacillus composti]KRM33375.1 hypothetical protein FC83_GL002944 [Agrilactobacillus composti DSM 18527 = JCM 14202]GAF41952.1 hypothetical protein JCM14202_3925 [Agrilactobacillus composti DSM 18527 = JCM 14202]